LNTVTFNRIIAVKSDEFPNKGLRLEKLSWKKFKKMNSFFKFSQPTPTFLNIRVLNDNPETEFTQFSLVNTDRMKSRKYFCEFFNHKQSTAVSLKLMDM